MTQPWIRTAAMLLASASLAACVSTPQYPVRTGENAGTGPQPPRPTYPITRQAAAQPAAQVASEDLETPGAEEGDDPVAVAPPTSPVDKALLAPVTSEPLPAPTMQPAEPPVPVDATPTGDGQPMADNGAYDPQGDAAVRLFGDAGATGEPTLLLAAAKKKPAESSKKKPAETKKGDSKKKPEAAAKPSSSKAVPGVVAGGAVVDASGPPIVYTVKSGDTVDGVARKLDTTRKALADANDLESPYKLKPGQKLKGPQSHAKAYVVQSGDTLYAIARRFTVDPDELADYNDMKVSAALRPGKKLLLPTGYKDKGVPKPPPAPKPTRPERPVVQEPPPEPAYTPPEPSYQPPRPQPPAPQPQPPAPKPIPLTREPVDVAPSRTPGNQPGRPANPIRPDQPPATVPTSPGPQPYRPTTPPVTRPSVPPSQPMIETAAPVSDSEIASLGRGRFAWPVRGEIISDYGPKGAGQRNDGLNIRAGAGTAVRAAADGEVVYAGDQVPGFGNLVLIKHADGWVTAYAHLARTDVKMRQTVTAGQQIGQIGSSGGVGEPQLHFEVRYSPSPREKARAVNPMLVLPQ